MSEIDAQALRKAEEFVEQEEGATHRFAGAWGVFLFACAVAMSLFHLYSAYGTITTTTLRYAHVGFVLFLGFLLFPMFPKGRNRFSWLDLGFALIGVAAAIGRRRGQPRDKSAS